MPQYKLTYFDIDGGRAEPIRIAFHAGGIEFEDNRISFPQFPELRDSLRFKSVPILEIDGAQISQSNAISRYIGKLTGFYPEDNLQALHCDEVLGALEDITHYTVRTYGLPEDELRKARQELIDGWLTIFLNGLDQLLIRGGGQFFADNKVTIADLRCFVQMRALGSGVLDHVPTDIVQRLSPSLFEHQQRINDEAIVQAYYATR